LNRESTATLLSGVRNCRALELQQFDGGAGGSLTIAEHGRVLPFDFKRVFYITSVGDRAVVRGKHAHKTLQQAIFAAQGSFLLEVDDGKQKASVLLDRPQAGVYLGPMLWHEMREFSRDCVAVVFAAAAYDERDYIRDYGEFLKLTSG
jgi:dTDP-4-dehydrorhamnose 3,5-epimerase-like enzyme